MLVEKKLIARNKKIDDFHQAIAAQLNKLMQEDDVRNDFNAEMSRFIPKQIKERTVDNPEYWAYVQTEVNDIVTELFNDIKPKNPFDMGL
ncbi:TPA: hypothetical protein ACS7XF_001606 [Providencia alcalifaciens]